MFASLGSDIPLTSRFVIAGMIVIRDVNWIKSKFLKLYNVKYLNLLEYCPPGWRAVRNMCLRTFEVASAIDYQGALATCQDEAIGGDPIALPMSPYNENLNEELKAELSNATLSETEFWIGNYYYFC